MIIKLFNISAYNTCMLYKECDEELYAPGGLRMYGGPPDESIRIQKCLNREFKCCYWLNTTLTVVFQLFHTKVIGHRIGFLVF